MRPNLGLSEIAHEKSVQQLEKLLANIYVLYVKTQNFHWNIESPHFGALHAFFEEQYKELAEDIDTIAERIRALGSYAPGSLKFFYETAELHEEPGALKAMAMCRQLLQDREHIIGQMKAIIAALDEHDIGTGNMLEDRVEAYEKAAWMLRAHLAE